VSLSKTISTAPLAVALICMSTIPVAHAEGVSSDSTKTVSSQSEEQLIVPWDEMNLKFRGTYAEARNATLSESAPIVIFRENKIILHHKGKREEYNINSPKYTLLKSVSHVPLALFCMLHSRVDKPLDDAAIKHINDFRESFIKASSNLEQWNLEDPVLQRQKFIISASAKLVDDVTKNRTISDAALLNFCREMGPPVLEDSAEATSLELTCVDDHLRQWRSTMSDKEWKDLRVIVLSPHMPRAENRIMQYFNVLFKEKREGDHIIYAEGRTEEAYGKDLLGTHLVDKDIAVYFFKDPWRMHRDLLSDGAKRYLKKHKPLK